MQRISIALLLLVLAGCTTSGSGNMQNSGPPYLTVYHANKINPNLGDTTALQASDIKAINDEIAAGNERDWGLQEEVLQQSMDDSM